MKKKLLFIILGVLLLGVLTGCSNTKFKEEYESLNGKENKNGKIHRTITIDKDNPFEYASAEKIVKMIEDKKTFYVYFGDPLCPWCRSVLEKFIEVAKKNNIDKVYYVKIWDDEGNEVLRTKYQVVDDNVRAAATKLNLGLSSVKAVLERTSLYLILVAFWEFRIMIVSSSNLALVSD